ncbi:MAG: membrane protein [Gemmatales bacterium]|nr:MAG: membrane protein [Gemmatales bacterium]
MRRFLLTLWKRGFIGTFLTGLFALLPLVVTFWIMDWVAGLLRGLVGPDSLLGRGLRSVGLHFAANEYVATAIGWAIVIAVIWLVGLIVSGTARYRLQEWFDGRVKQIPVIKSIYGPVKQVIEMFSKKDESAVTGMQVVHCRWGADESSSFLGLLPSKDTYRFQDQDCHIVYLPSAPMPMTGFNMFIPVSRIRVVEMSVEDLMQVYFSLGVMTSSVVPADLVASSKAVQ